MTAKSATPMITERFIARCHDGAGGTRICLPPRWVWAFAFAFAFAFGLALGLPFLPFSGLSGVGST